MTKTTKDKARAERARQWSSHFTTGARRVVNISVTGVTPTFRNRFSAKCRRMDVSQRNLLLEWIRNWIEDRRPDEGRPSSGQDPT